MQISRLYTVTMNQTAQSLGSGDLAVLGTPALLGFVEATCNELGRTLLEPAETSVGINVQLNHLKASPVGATIQVEGRLIERTKRILTYEFEVFQEADLIAKGNHQRAIVETKRFLSSMQD